MAIYHQHIAYYQRREGASSIGGIAYRRGLKLRCRETGKRFDFRRKEEVCYSEFIRAVNDKRQHDFASIRALFEQVEAAEKHPRASVGREIECALPNEFSLDEQVSLTRAFIAEIRKSVDADRCFFDYSIHAKNGNNHVHIFMSERELNDGYSLSKNKRRDHGDKTFVRLSREIWEEVTNKALSKNNIDARVDCRTLAAQGLHRLATVHEGRTRYITNRKERRTMNEEIRKANEAIHEMEVAEANMDGEVRDAKQANGTDEESLAAYRIAKRLYDTNFTLPGLSYINTKHPRYTTLFFRDPRSQIADHGDRLTAVGGTAKSNARLVIELAKLKQWEAIKLSGSAEFVEAVMMEALEAGISIEPADDEQARLLERLNAERACVAKALAGKAQVAMINKKGPKPATLANLAAKIAAKREKESTIQPRRSGKGPGL